MTTPNSYGAPAPGSVTPECDEARVDGSDPSFEREKYKWSEADFAASSADRKWLATLRAVLALHGGHVVHELDDGAFLVTWRAFSRECRDLDDLEAHARRVGALR